MLLSIANALVHHPQKVDAVEIVSESARADVRGHRLPGAALAHERRANTLTVVDSPQEAQLVVGSAVLGHLGHDLAEDRQLIGRKDQLIPPRSDIKPLRLAVEMG